MLIHLLAEATWSDIAVTVLSLIAGLIALVIAGVGVYYAIKKWIQKLKDKNALEIWTMIMQMANAAIDKIENSEIAEEDKKQAIIDAVKAACKTAELDIDDFLDQLSDYIDQVLKFVKEMKQRGHTCEGTWEIKTEPTCTTDGQKEMKCTICGVKTTEVIPATGHTTVYRDAVEPTCTEEGKTAEEYCEVCGEVLNAAQTIQPKGHQYEYVPETKATCTHAGQKAHYVCTVCGEYFTDPDKQPIDNPQTLVEPQLEHTKVLVPGYAADCEKDGLTDGYKCETCDTILEEQKPIPRYHVFKGKEYAHEEGYETYEDRPEFEHYNGWDYATKTTKDIGLASFVCEKCGRNIVIKIHGINPEK